MSIITNIITGILISSMIYTSYSQQLLITTEIYSQRSIQVKEKSINKDLKYLKEDIKIPQLIGGKDKERIETINNKINNDIILRVKEAEKSANEYFGMPGSTGPTFPYEIKSIYNVTNDGKQILSLYNDYYEYLGGAHGMTTRTSYTVDKDKEVLLNLKDLFIKGYDYQELINKEIRSQISKEPEIYFDSGKEFKGITPKQNFYIEGDNLIIYYGLYELAPYVAGIREFKIPLKTFGNNYVYYQSIK